MQRSAEFWRGADWQWVHGATRAHIAEELAAAEAREAFPIPDTLPKVPEARQAGEVKAAESRLAEAERERDAVEAILAGMRGALEEARKDNEELDGTDAAHPAWWRGNDAGVSQVCAKINAILDGADVFGTASEPWESTRRRVAEARKDSERLAWAWANPDKFAEAQLSTPPNRTGRQQIDAARGTE